MSIFAKLLKEAVEETEKEQELLAAEEEVEEITDPEEEIEELPEDEPTDEEVPVESDMVNSVRDLIDSVLDAMEEGMVSDGESIEGSIDIGLELISKYADVIPTDTLQIIYDEISEYYETELIEDEEGEETKEDDFFEEPIEEIPEEDEITVESILRKKG